ncbi:uncharacterized protein PHACADRAFT_201682 [Phanerochaete carnosa HHB-10118-sp]|uniref:DUF6532 domain-containing protein n=1 Tax=Phanerochaete carnosa (strain HHB-10118-sp) TaxID=650164 RepID=K5VRN9_PHACS|nr:uncharacterized protein PHACADRAFT_201682 [Phanerochaete carnosa HHB-10118-sp]EKM49420.1 hypothetical protein PHACADRAFT_201682 [Phanerochaete carnosa HHB-10118-sp]
MHKIPSVAHEFLNRFKSSIQYKEHELEIPVPMLRLTCAMIKLSLDAWAEGDGTDPDSFNITECEKQYDAVLKLIEDTRKRSEQTCHCILHNVYLAVTGAVPTVPAAADEPAHPEAVS